MLYVPPHFRQTDADALIAEIRAGTGFATLISNGMQEPVITHLPLMHDAEGGPLGRLIGHIARANPHWKVAVASDQSVAVFQGPDSYVTPSWYPAKKEHGKVVPTWNYAVVHAKGRLVFHDDTGWLRDTVVRQTAHHEQNRPMPWAVDDAPEDFVRGQLKGIIGVELVITEMVGKKKLSQNRSEADQAGVIAGLSNENPAMHEAMLRQEK